MLIAPRLLFLNLMPSQPLKVGGQPMTERAYFVFSRFQSK
nr:MAG TPA: hypothetical protein [Caudoviricetes sp.]